MDINLVENKKDGKPVLYLKIENSDIFAPDYIGEVGKFVGLSEKTKPEDKVRNYEVTSNVSLIEYSYMGKKYKNYYHFGEWITMPDNTPCFYVKGILNNNGNGTQSAPSGGR